MFKRREHNPPGRTIHVTGMGAVTAAGLGPEALWKSACDEIVAPIDGLGSVDEARLIAAIDGETDLPYREECLRLALDLPRSRFALITLYAIAEAMRDAGWTALGPDDGIVLGTTTGNILLWEPAVIGSARGEITEAALGEAIRSEPLSLCLESLATTVGFTGRTRVVSSACASSAQAIALGALWLRNGTVKRCLAGGTEVLCRLTIDGFRSLQLLSSRAAAPFDEARSGINLAEGAAFLCLERSAKAKARAAVTGFGHSSDAFHMTAPHPEGRGCYEAMRAAIETAGLTPLAITWIHAHGTGSAANDAAEGAAVAKLFGGSETAPWISSTKAIHGHALAASGAIETVLALMAIRHGKIPRTAGLSTPDPKLSLRHPPRAIDGPIRHVLKNSLGFGGANASLVLSHPEAAP